MVEAADVDRTTWAALVAALITSEAGGNQTKFAALVGVTPRTISRWLEQKVAVKSENVKAVARALGHKPTDYLARVGYLTAEEASVDPALPMDPDVLAIMRRLADPAVPEAQKAAIKQLLRALDQLPVSGRGETEHGQAEFNTSS